MHSSCLQIKYRVLHLNSHDHITMSPLKFEIHVKFLGDKHWKTHFHPAALVKFAKEFPYPEDLMKVKRSLTLIESHTYLLLNFFVCLKCIYGIRADLQ